MYKVKNNFTDSTLGFLEKGQPVEDSERAKVLHRLGYLEKVEYKTKVVESTPKKRKPKK
jgi:hypothetical protein